VTDRRHLNLWDKVVGGISLDILFEVTDPRGRIVRCTWKQWNNHILAQRNWMEGWQDEVKAAIEGPSIGIYADAHHHNREVYYRLRPVQTRYLKVIVEFSGNMGVVITAYPVNSPKSGERMIWPLSSR
jgi:hypothetical protein